MNGRPANTTYDHSKTKDVSDAGGGRHSGEDQVTPDYTDNGRFPVRQHGPRRLWDEAETAHTWWIQHGRPMRNRYGLTITPATQTVWLDERSNTVAALRERLLPAGA